MKSADVKITIVTITYNLKKAGRENTFRQCVESVHNQTYKNIEHIIIDGGSTDGSLDLIKEYAKKGWVTYISEPDSGVYDAMNKGIRMATGDVIGILNSDDFLTSNDVIERMTKEFPENVEAVYGDVHFVKERNLQKSVRYYSGKPFHPWMVRFGFIPPHPSLYVRSSTYKRYGLYDTSFRISADVEMIARLSYINNVRMKYINMDFVTMLVGGESTKNIHNRWLGTKEDLIACRKLGIKSNIVFVHFKYFLKTFGYLFVK